MLYYVVLFCSVRRTIYYMVYGIQFKVDKIENDCTFRFIGIDIGLGLGETVQEVADAGSDFSGQEGYVLYEYRYDMR